MNVEYLCVRCSWPPHVCPCRKNQTTALEVQRRHRVAVRRARAHGWPTPPLARIVTDPTGRRWVA